LIEGHRFLDCDQRFLFSRSTSSSPQYKQVYNGHFKQVSTVPIIFADRSPSSTYPLRAEFRLQADEAIPVLFELSLHPFLGRGKKERKEKKRKAPAITHTHMAANQLTYGQGRAGQASI